MMVQFTDKYMCNSTSESLHPISRVTSQMTLHWRHHDHHSVSNHQPHGYLFNLLFRRISNKTSKLRVTGLCVGNSPGPVNSPHKGTVTRKMFPFDDVIITRRLAITGYCGVSVMEKWLNLPLWRALFWKFELFVMKLNNNHSHDFYFFRWHSDPLVTGSLEVFRGAFTSAVPWKTRAYHMPMIHFLQFGKWVFKKLSLENFLSYTQY